MFSPFLYTNPAIGTEPSAIADNNVFPQPNPSAAYILGPASGSKAPPILLNTVFAAVALAAYGVNASTIYVVIGIKLVMIPIPKRTCPRRGTIQACAYRAAHPYQSNPLLTHKRPTIRGGSRYSGFISPPLARRAKILSDTRPKLMVPIVWPIPMAR